MAKSKEFSGAARDPGHPGGFDARQFENQEWGFSYWTISYNAIRNPGQLDPGQQDMTVVL